MTDQQVKSPSGELQGHDPTENRTPLPFHKSSGEAQPEAL